MRSEGGEERTRRQNIFLSTHRCNVHYMHIVVLSVIYAHRCHCGDLSISSSQSIMSERRRGVKVARQTEREQLGRNNRVEVITSSEGGWGGVELDLNT